MHNAQALQMMVTANRAAPDEMGEILADIQAEAVLATQIIDRHRTMLRSRQLQKKPIDLHAVIDESLALVAHDMRARQIEATLDLSSTPCVIDGDQVLLQQVLVNLLRNAMDALAETPPARRHITIRSAVRAADVEVSVCDTGTGLPAEIIDTLFTPFVTTKSHGLGIGLTIAQSRSSTPMAGPSPPTRIPTAARHSLSRCPAAQRPGANDRSPMGLRHPRSVSIGPPGGLRGAAANCRKNSAR